jgi:5-methyltetrahydrofolate--homocysteine methyltransferase
VLFRSLWPARREDEDVVLYSDEDLENVVARFPMLRQQSIQASGKPNRSLADFVAPRSSGIPDYIGAFALTSGREANDLAAGYEKDNDDYRAIMVKSIADRLAEAFAELLHTRVRKEWGFGADESLSNEDLIAERYRGIRPAFGYPACPDHLPKRTLFELLKPADAGIELTETCAMNPAASVSGLYFAHPDARYFTVGRLGRDQIEDYAPRIGLPIKETERWLGPNLGY